MISAEDVVLASFDMVVSMADRDKANKVDATVGASEFWSLVVTFSVFTSVTGAVTSPISVAYV